MHMTSADRWRVVPGSKGSYSLRHSLKARATGSRTCSGIELRLGLGVGLGVGVGVGVGALELGIVWVVDDHKLRVRLEVVFHAQVTRLQHRLQRRVWGACEGAG